MPIAPAHLSPPASVDDATLVDQELLDLPAPPKRDRSMAVAILMFTALASLAMVAALRQDVAFACVGAHPTDVGDLGATSNQALVESSYIRGHAMLGAAHAIKFERPLATSSFRLMPVAGRPNVWVEVRLPPGAENARYVPPTEFTGHLVRFDSAGPRHRGLASAIHDATGQKVPDGSWLLIDGESPAAARWAIVLVIMFLGFAVWNVNATAKLLRKVR